ncbi:MAG: radical SAM protein [Candidatus Lokiarchaeota archaeon]|nr:radical SAM protein [Candidatus Lokiarchaeota archaeon]
MNKTESLFRRFESNQASWYDYSEFIQLPDEQLERFFDLSYKIKLNNLGTLLKIYIPDDRFPAISITGDQCELSCEHCNEKYLKGMEPLTTNSDLYHYLINHAKNGGVGALISGGCLSDGSVPLYEYLDTIKKIKKETNLIINAHTGLLNEETARKLSDANVDIVSFDINIDPEIIQNIYHLDKSIEDYQKSIRLLQKYNLNVIPHICIGLHYGELAKELDCIKFIKEIDMDPSLIVFIALIPPKNSHMKFKTPSILDISKIIALTRFIFPNKEISLGCMRPRGTLRQSLEKAAIKAGINRLEMPSRYTLKWLYKNYPQIKLKFFSSCCAIKIEDEIKSTMKDTKIKKYLRI